MKHALGYIRVSGKGQLEGDGFERQRIAISAYAEANGYVITQWFEEKGVSGTIDGLERPAWREMIAQCTADAVVIIERLDRLARDLMVQESALKDARQRDLTVISTAEPDLCSDDPTRKLIRQIIGAVAEYDRAQIVAKLKGARQRAKERRGRCEGAKPFGSKPGESRVIERARQLRESGLSYQDVARVLNAEGARCRHAGSLWHAASIFRVLRAAAMHPSAVSARLQGVASDIESGLVNMGMDKHAASRLAATVSPEMDFDSAWRAVMAARQTAAA